MAALRDEVLRIVRGPVVSGTAESSTGKTEEKA